METSSPARPSTVETRQTRRPSAAAETIHGGDQIDQKTRQTRQTKTPILHHSRRIRNFVLI